MPSYELLFPSKYLRASDLLGKDATITIATIAMGELVRQGGTKEQKPLVTFHETEKQLVLNKTNAKSVAALYGNDTDSWIGQRVTLFVSRVQGPGGNTVDAIRIRDVRPQPKQRKTTQAEPVDLPPEAYGDQLAAIEGAAE